MSRPVREMAEAARRAAERLHGRVRTTPVIRSPALSAAGARVHLKLENLQYTGSFKVRGAFNRLLTLDEPARRRGVVAASSGNHGAAVAFAMRELGIPGVVFVPDGTADVKVDAIRAAGADVRFFGDDGLDTELHAREYARGAGMRYVSPYNDPEVVAGQGTCGVEILEQLPAVDAVFVAVGGGGLVSGIGSVLRTSGRDVRIIGCQPRRSAVMSASVAAGRILDLPGGRTLSDGTAGGVEQGAITFDLCRDVVDEFVCVDEDAIAAAMRACIESEHQVVEGAAGVAVAAMLARRADYADRDVLAVVCGGNVGRKTLTAVLREQAVF